MYIGAALIGIGMLVLAGVVVIQPLRIKVRQPELPDDDTGNDYDAALLALRDLEFDHQLSVVSNDDYARMKGILMTQAAQALEQQVEARSRLDEAIEKAIQAKRRASGELVGCLHCQQLLAAGDKFCPQCGRMAEASCPVCQQAGTPGDNFCADCGTSFKSALDYSSAIELLDTGKE